MLCAPGRPLLPIIFFRHRPDALSETNEQCRSPCLDWPHKSNKKIDQDPDITNWSPKGRWFIINPTS
jgi:hypothetical protein